MLVVMYPPFTQALSLQAALATLLLMQAHLGLALPAVDIQYGTIIASHVPGFDAHLVKQVDRYGSTNPAVLQI
jgi:hypothetical protein